MKLDPCPFCFKKAKLIGTYSIKREWTYFHIKCTYCGIRTPKFIDSRSVIEFWNNRVRI